MELCLTQALESHYSTHPRTFNSKSSLEVVVHQSSGFAAPRRAPFDRRPGEPGAVFRASGRIAAALVCAFAIFAAGCHRNNLTSGYGNVWVTLTDDPGDFTSYIVNVDSITLTRNDGAVVTALATAETVDLAKLNNYAELWGTAVVPIGTYLSASIVSDFTNAVNRYHGQWPAARQATVVTQSDPRRTVTVQRHLRPGKSVRHRPDLCDHRRPTPGHRFQSGARPSRSIWGPMRSRFGCTY